MFFAVGCPGSSGKKLVTRQFLYDKMQGQNLINMDEKLAYLENYLFSSYGDTEENIKKLKQNIAYFKTAIKKKWSKAQRKEDIFLKSNQSWLNGTFEIPIQAQIRPGRPSKSFEELSERSKRRKTEVVRSAADDSTIIHAAQSTLRAKGLRNASEILKEITKSPTRATKYRKAYKSSSESDKHNVLTPQEALEMFVEADLTRQQYEIIRKTNKSLYPCYDRLLEAKKVSFPSEQYSKMTQLSAEYTLQSLIDITLLRFSIYLEEVLLTTSEDDRQTLTIINKWGCDGSQQARYKQMFDNPEESDSNIFLSSFVPLQIFCGKNYKKVIWENPSPSSPRFCRPIRFQFVKESDDVTKEEIRYVEESVKRLIPTDIEINGNKFTYKHIFKMTMIDGKVCNAATNTKSTSRCFICKATSKDFNDLSKKYEVSPETLEFGLSVLHARIRIFESILHLGYKLEVQKYRQKKTTQEKNVELAAKKRIQDRFRIETGLLIDMPKANYGNTNDGNTSRRFFENPRLASDITGVNYDLIYRLKVILETISSGYVIDAKKYDEYALDTAKLYVQHYSWHPMTPTLHKVLIHGAAIIENSLLPIGQLSEEAQEARNKHFRMYRENYARKFSREQCNRDIYHRLLLSSDPLISSRSIKQRRSKKMSKSFSPETLDMLLPTKPDSTFTESSDDEDLE